jgi:hypothetical protein
MAKQMQLKVSSIESIQKKTDVIRHYFVHFILMLKEKYVLPEKPTEGVVGEMSFMVEEIHNLYSMVFNNLLRPHRDMHADLFTSLAENDACKLGFVKQSVYADTFEDCSSDYYVCQYLKKNQLLVQSCKEYIKVGELSINFQYVFVSVVLQNLLNKSEVSEHKLETCDDNTDEDYLCNYTDGSAFKNHQLFSQHPDTLPLHAYADEFEVCNPLGAQRGKRKVLGIY